jgi:hypothetical protein
MDWRIDRKHYTKYCSKWRRSNRGILKPNHRYFMGKINKITNEFLTNNKKFLLAHQPEIYYSMKGKKLPKKYQNFQPFNIHSVIRDEPVETPPPKQDPYQLQQEEEKKRLKEEKLQQEKIAKKKEQDRIRRNREAAERENSYIRWVDPFEPVNKNKLGHSQSWRIEKKYEYY